MLWNCKITKMCTTRSTVFWVMGGTARRVVSRTARRQSLANPLPCGEGTVAVWQFPLFSLPCHEKYSFFSRERILSPLVLLNYGESIYYTNLFCSVIANVLLLLQSTHYGARQFSQSVNTVLSNQTRPITCTRPASLALTLFSKDNSVQEREKKPCYLEAFGGVPLLAFSGVLAECHLHFLHTFHF